MVCLKWHQKVSKDGDDRDDGQISCLNPQQGTRKMPLHSLAIIASHSLFTIPMSFVLAVIFVIATYGFNLCSNGRKVEGRRKHFLPLFSYIILSISGFTISIHALYSFVFSFFHIRMSWGTLKVGMLGTPGVYSEQPVGTLKEMKNEKLGPGNSRTFSFLQVSTKMYSPITFIKYLLRVRNRAKATKMNKPQ